jgi:hypothetical protein
MLTRRLVFVMIALACGSTAAADTKNYIDLGGGMTQCNNMGSNGSMSTTNCTNMGGGMSSCSTMDMSQPSRGVSVPDMSQPQNNGSTMSFIGTLVAQSQERSFKKKLGEMIGKGDCVGAKDFAFSKGRLELGMEIGRACGSTGSASIPTVTTQSSQQALSIDPSGSPKVSVPQAQLETRLNLAAAKANAAMPMAFDKTTTATKVEAIGTQILISAVASGTNTKLTDAIRSSVIDQICANPSMPDLLRAGASIRIKYYDDKKSDIGAVMVTRFECGL